MASSSPDEPVSAHHLATVAVAWLERHYPELHNQQGAELHDLRLARVVASYRVGGVESTSVVDAVREWRSHVGAVSRHGWDGHLARLIDHTPRVDSGHAT